MERSFAEVMGFDWPKDLACVVNGERITYLQIKERKIMKQRKHLEKVLRHDGPVRHAAYVWVFYQPGLLGFAYQGYWLSIWTLRHTWTFRFRLDEMVSGLSTIDVMRMFPCGYLPLIENFEYWKEAFVRKYLRPGRFKKQGLVMGWVECDYEGGWPQRFIGSL